MYEFTILLFVILQIWHNIWKMVKSLHFSRCCYIDCNNGFYRQGFRTEWSFFSFPKDKARKRRWCNLIKRQDGRDNFHADKAKICHAHFHELCISVLLILISVFYLLFESFLSFLNSVPIYTDQVDLWEVYGQLKVSESHCSQNGPLMNQSPSDIDRLKNQNYLMYRSIDFIYQRQVLGVQACTESVAQDIFCISDNLHTIVILYMNRIYNGKIKMRKYSITKIYNQ